MSRRQRPKHRDGREVAARRMEAVSSLVGMGANELRHHSRRCRDKQVYESEKLALEAASECGEKFGCDFYCYQCPWCGRFHLTTHPWKR